MKAASPHPLAVIGFGFSGLMLLANLLRETTAPITIYVIDAELDARGVAYRTTEPLHLLNVPAEKMGAWADAPGDFLRWLTTHGKRYSTGDYVPRMLYGEYLESIWRETQATATRKHCSIKLVPSRAVAVHQAADGLTITTERGDAIAIGHAVLALGNEAKRLYPHLPNDCIVQHPWNDGALNGCARAGSIALIGASLTAIDALMSLRALGYQGHITAFSRHGRLPHVHCNDAGYHHFERTALLEHTQSLSGLLQFVRRTIRQRSGDWRAVIDGLRPHTQTLWRALPAPDQQRFISRLASVWGLHRHRMAPSIAARIKAEIAANTFSLVAAKHLHAAYSNDTLSLHWNDAAGTHALTTDVIINCAGVHFDVARSSNPLLQQMLHHGLIEPHVTGIGIAVDASLRVHGAAAYRLYALGGLLSGQLFETIAVPELREQAARIARTILQ